MQIRGFLYRKLKPRHQKHIEYFYDSFLRPFKFKQKLTKLDLILIFIFGVGGVIGLGLLESNFFYFTGSLLAILFILIDINGVHRVILILGSFGIMGQNLILFSFLIVGYILIYYKSNSGYKKEDRKQSEELKRKREEKQRKLEERRRERELRKQKMELEQFEKNLIGKKKVSPFNIKDFYLDSYVKKYGDKREYLENLRKVLEEKGIKLDKPLEHVIYEHFEKEQKRKGLEKFVDSEGNEKWGTKEQIKKWKEIDLGLADNFSSISPKDFEEMMAKLLEKMGYRDVKVTKSTGDYGVDIIAKKRNRTIAVQCKKWRGGVVGNKDIQSAVGAASYYHAKKLIFITTARFTKEAIEQAEDSSLEVELWDKDELGQMIREYLIK